MNSSVPRQSLPQPTRTVPTSGVLHVRPRYCECDPMGVVHHAAYIPWLEMGRTEMLREAGVTYAQMEASGVFLVIVRLECRYKRPARYDEPLEVRTRVSGGSRVKIEHEYEIARVNETGEVIFTGGTTLVCVDGLGKVRELPEWLIGGA